MIKILSHRSGSIFKELVYRSSHFSVFCKNKTFSVVIHQVKTVYCHSFARTLGIGRNSSFSQLQTLETRHFHSSINHQERLFHKTLHHQRHTGKTGPRTIRGRFLLGSWVVIGSWVLGPVFPVYLSLATFVL